MDKCSICDDTGWVCEGHAGRPWRGVSNREDACECGPGVPCRECNPCDADTPPDMSRACRIVFDKDGWRH